MTLKSTWNRSRNSDVAYRRNPTSYEVGEG